MLFSKYLVVKKSYILSVGSIVLLSGVRVSAQQVAYFETTIYVEDAIGNKDSVVIGHDPDANGMFNPEFGELDITAPFDSVLEVRAAHRLSFPGNNMILSKSIIGPVEQSSGSFYEPDSCYLYPEEIILFIHALHQPVTVTWDRNIFDESYCRRGSFITSHIIPSAVPDWFLDTAALALSACLAETYHYSAMLFDYGDWGFYKIHEIEGIGIDTIYAMLITPTFRVMDNTPCQGLVSNQDPLQSDTELHSYPNPASDIIILDTGADPVVGFEIFDLSGRCVLMGNESKVDLEELPTGIYFISVVTDAGQRQVGKIVKQ